MKRYLLVFIGYMLLLFAMPKSSDTWQPISVLQQDTLKKACAAQHSCPGKCLAKHSKDQNKPESLLTECSLQLYGVLPQQKMSLPFKVANTKVAKLPVLHKYLSPDLKADPDPPRYS